jgi:LemA protein
MSSTLRQPPHSPPQRARRGALSTGLIIGIGVVLLLGVMGLMTAGAYNSLVGAQEHTSQAWADVENQYKRRFDLIPNLVNTVQGAAEFEKSTLTEVTNARASVGKLAMPPGGPANQAQLDEFSKAQSSLGSSLSRLLVVAERYPELKATQNFLSLQDQLEGTENRIATARNDYTVAVRQFNTGVRSFPGNLIAGVFGFETLPQFTVSAEEQAVPQVDFSDDE